MNEKRFELRLCSNGTYYVYENGELVIDHISFDRFNKDNANALIGLLNEQQELIEELQVSDEMGWKRAEHFEKKFEKELKQKKIYIKRLEYKVQKFKEENKKLQCINDQLEERLEHGGIGVALKMDCEKDEG